MLRNVRKLVTLLLAIGLVSMNLAGCNTSKSNETSGPQSSAASTEDARLEQATIYVFIAASLNNAMTDIQEMYQKVQPDITIVFNADSSGTLKTQIEQGAECDIFFSAAMKQMNELDTGGYIEAGTITELLENQVVLIKPKGEETAVKGFDTITAAENIALAGEDVPVGAYAREIFTNLGILDKVMAMEINQGANVSAVLAAVSEGSNEAGVVYATDAAFVKDKVDIIASAPAGSLKTPVIYPAGLVKNAGAGTAQTAAAKDFLEFLQNDEVIDVFSQYGFIKAE